MMYREMEKSRIWTAQMANLKGLLDNFRIERVPNAQIRELCRLIKGVDERADESML